MELLVDTYKCVSVNEDPSAANFCPQVAAWVPYMFCNFYLVKNRKIDNNLTTTKARKISTGFKSVEFWNFFDVCLTKLRNNHTSCNKISHRFLLATKLFSG